EGLFTYRVADRRGDHSDHRGYRDSELAAFKDRRQRILGCGFGAYDRHRGSNVLLDLGYRLLAQLAISWRRRRALSGGLHLGIVNRVAVERGSIHQERLYV